MVGIFDTKSTSFPTNEKISLPNLENNAIPNEEGAFPFLDFISDEYSFRGGFDLIFPAPDWQSYVPLLGKLNPEIYSAIVER
jgi:hypothetical protein